MCVLFRFGYTFGMRCIAATLAVVAALLFSAAGPASADFLSDVLSDTDLSGGATFTYHQRQQPVVSGDDRVLVKW
mgnify:CR=1 FL=1